MSVEKPRFTLHIFVPASLLVIRFFRFFKGNSMLPLLGRITSISKSTGGFYGQVFSADGRFLHRGRFYWHSGEWEGEFPTDLRIGDRVAFIPSAPNRKGQQPKAVRIRRIS